MANRQYHFIFRHIALALAFLSAIPTFAGDIDGGAGGMNGHGDMVNPASDLMKMMGSQEIIKGTMNETQGKQMQNMAQMAMGAMQIAQGILGMLASAAAAGQGAKDAGNASGMSSLSPYSAGTYNSGATAPTPTNNGSTTPGTSSSGELAATTAQIGITPSDLRSGPLGSAMDAIEANHGIPRDKFLEALKAGVNPKDLLANAPKNAVSMDLLNRIADGLAANKGGDASRVLASVGTMAGSGAGGMSTAPTPATGEVEVAKGGKVPSSSSSAEEEADTDPNLANVSPEIKAALARKAEAAKAEKEMRDSHGWNLFQLVHNRYRKLETMLYGRVERTNPAPARY